MRPVSQGSFGDRQLWGVWAGQNPRGKPFFFVEIFGSKTPTIPALGRHGLFFFLFFFFGLFACVDADASQQEGTSAEELIELDPVIRMIDIPACRKSDHLSVWVVVSAHLDFNFRGLSGAPLFLGKGDRV